MNFNRFYRGASGFPGGNNNEWHTMTYEQAAQRLGYAPNEALFQIFREAEMFGMIKKAQRGLYSFHPEFFQHLSKKGGSGGGYPEAGGYPGGGSGGYLGGGYPGSGEYPSNGWYSSGGSASPGGNNILNTIWEVMPLQKASDRLGYGPGKEDNKKFLEAISEADRQDMVKREGVWPFYSFHPELFEHLSKKVGGGGRLPPIGDHHGPGVCPGIGCSTSHHGKNCR
jgi:hypothetical protein